MKDMLKFEEVAKTFVLHVQQGAKIPIFARLDLAVGAGECVVLRGPSGMGKSTILRLAHGNYRCLEGRILARHDGGWVDLANASPHQVIAVRRHTIGYVSQFLRVVPRVSTIDIVAEPARLRGASDAAAANMAAELLTRLNLPERLWPLSPVTFSGGEQQRVNIARGFIADYPVLLLDEPTASLDALNRQVVIELIDEARQRGAAILGIFHDGDVRAAVATREFDVAAIRVAA
ncbi:MAG: phosphonate C-P lyase system protein PhnL [Alphaproteobacteria bacterium]|nr:phosphonate C-P lyase system protein PhnL [Alphaproteobacteria bacterium]